MGYDEHLQKEMPIQVWLSYGVCKLYTIKGEQINKIRFRDWNELDTYFYKLKCGFKKKLICFVHNLSYEFDFLIKNLCDPKSFICNSSHNVIAATLTKYNIEFRCTYQLSKMSLEKIGELVNLPKLDSDYRDIYPDDEVTEEEWLYCERDCDIIVPYVMDELKEYKMICKIPYTSTGKVRRRLKEKFAGYKDTDWDLMPPEDCFIPMCKSFRGGLTMSNPRFTGQVINTLVKSYDEKSKYPSVALVEEYPYNIRKLTEFNNDTYKNYKFWIGKVRLNNVYTNFEWGVISQCTCEYVDPLTIETFNGKILNCKTIELYLCNVELDYIKEVYYIESIEFLELCVCDKYDRLPSPFIDLIKEFAEKKVQVGCKLETTLEEYGENSEEYIEVYKEYMDAKALLNGIYGMMVQKLTPQEFYIDENYIWHEKENPYKYIEGKHMGRNFLFGIFITAYSRRDLVINIIKNCPDNLVYVDTDSIKYIYIGKEFVDYNKDLPDYLKEFDYLDGFNKFEEEKPYNKFLTYGAKKYCYERKGKFGFTVAGLPKNTKISSMSEFTLGSVYKNCKLAKRYIYCQKVTDIDCYTNEIIQEMYLKDDVDSKGGVALFEVDYKLDMTLSDKEYIERNLSRWQRKNIQQNILI